MQALLSFAQSPPLAAPLRFFLTAPCFAIGAGALLLASTPDDIGSRWTPTVLALTHLIAAGFMLQAMFGALLQIMPVVAGANMTAPLRVARAVHALISAGVLALVAAFLSYWPPLFTLAALLLGAGVVLFITAAGRSLVGLSATSPTLQGVRVALVGLGVTLFLGLLMSVSLGGSLDLPLLELADLHLGWGFVAWGTVLLAAVAYVVVPMFQLTPAYPGGFSRWFSFAVLTTALLWTLAVWASGSIAVTVSAGALVALAALFCALTLHIQRQSKRARFDATQQLWRVAMLCALAACLVWSTAQLSPDVAQSPAWPLVCGVLLLFGAFMSVIVGMLYKIVPFLIWLHLQNEGRGRVAAPNMKKIITERAMNRQALAHQLSCLLLLLAACWPEYFIHPAGGMLIVANGWLMRNLCSAVAVYRQHRAGLPAGGTGR